MRFRGVMCAAAMGRMVACWGRGLVVGARVKRDGTAEGGEKVDACGGEVRGVRDASARRELADERAGGVSGDLELVVEAEEMLLLELLGTAVYFGERGLKNERMEDWEFEAGGGGRRGVDSDMLVCLFEA
jgi:hypothetical protein